MTQTVGYLVVVLALLRLVWLVFDHRLPPPRVDRSGDGYPSLAPIEPRDRSIT